MGRFRTVEEAKKRGRWKSDSSLRRYAKETRVLSELSKVNPAVIEYGEALERQVGDILTKRIRPAKPPQISLESWATASK